MGDSIIKRWTTQRRHAAVQNKVASALNSLPKLSLPLALAIIVGCAARSADLQPIRPAGIETPTSYDDRSWATVVRENVKDGLVDYAHLSAHRDPLDAFLRMISTVGPNRTPKPFAARDAKTAYYINTYNAGVLLAVLDAGVPETMRSLAAGTIDQLYRLRVDGQSRTLAELRNLAVESSNGDMRVLFALCDAAIGSPPLHNQPVRAHGLDETLSQLARQAMDNHRIIAIDHELQRLLLSVDLAAHRQAFIAYYHAQTGAGQATMLSVVLRFAGNVRRQWLNTAVGYAEGLIPFDRRLNSWPPPE